MLRTPSLILLPDTPTPFRRLAAWLERVWSTWTLDDDERFVAAAHDVADLERRLRQLERGHGPRFAPLPRL